MKIVASIQARLGSSRLPGKVLKIINGKPMLYWHINRIKKSRLIDDIIVATTNNVLDDEIVEFCKEYSFKYFRGSENDVLHRVASLVKVHKADIHVEFFGDSPLSDPHLVDEFLGYFIKNIDDIDFLTNSLKTTYPPGQEVIIYKGDVLVKANQIVNINDPLREHVSLHIYQRPELFKIKNIQAPDYYNYPDIFLEVDTELDFEFVEIIFNHFYKNNQSHFSLAQILDFLSQNSELKHINSSVERRWKQYRDDE